MPCVYCEVKEGQRGFKKIYEDELCLAVIHPNPANSGHIIIFPKEHYTIIEQIPDFTVESLFVVANNLSRLLFETLPIQGTNLIIQNGVAAEQDIPHFAINIIPRTQEDGLDFQWEPKKFSEKEISTTELILRDLAKQLIRFESYEEKKELAPQPKTEETKEKEKDYLLKHLRRIP